MSKKVYCQDCEYVAPSWTLGFLQTDDHRCKHPLFVIDKNTPFHIEKEYASIKKLNKDNNCKYFILKKES
jgi:hypothetical protein